jgi:ribosomal protein L32
LEKRADKVLKLFDWSMSQRFEHLNDGVLQSEGGIDKIIDIMDRLAGIREGDDERRAARSCLFEYARKSDETLSQYVHRREQQFETAAAMDLSLPPKYRAILLEEGASLAPQGEQNLRTLTSGVLSYEGVSKALRDMDVARERMTVPPSGGKKNFMAEPEDEDALEQGSEDIDTEDENMILAEIDGQDIDEYEVPEILAVLQKQKKRTWAENKTFKQSIKKDRQFGMKSDSVASERPSGASDKKGYGGRKRLSVDQLKLVTKCGNCGEKGHWHKECSKPHRPRDPAKKTTAFAYALGHSHFSFTEMGTHMVNAIRQTRISAETFLTIEPGTAIVDTAAGQAIIGEKALNKHAES